MGFFGLYARALTAFVKAFSVFSLPSFFSLFFFFFRTESSERVRVNGKSVQVSEDGGFFEKVLPCYAHVIAEKPVVGLFLFAPFFSPGGAAK